MKIVRNIGLFVLIASLILNAYLILSKSTKKSDNIQNIQFAGQFVFNKKMDSLLNAFVEEVKNDSCFFEMYIDKRINETYILLRASIAYPNKAIKKPFEEYMSARKPLLFASVRKNVGFFVYTGIEEMLSLTSVDKQFKFKMYKEMFYNYYWTIVLVNGQYLVFKKVFINPYGLKFDYKRKISFEEEKGE
ncbi:hypothetical protein [Bacteroides sedimenti]|uniref:Uncharacterized protein n=1 Tax=Bacteroides sedimenti TaxID=2136147 RepID=A0ABM8IL89_9BACE